METGCTIKHRSRHDVCKFQLCSAACQYSLLCLYLHHTVLDLRSAQRCKALSESWTQLTPSGDSQAAQGMEGFHGPSILQHSAAKPRHCSEIGPFLVRINSLGEDIIYIYIYIYTHTSVYIYIYNIYTYIYIYIVSLLFIVRCLIPYFASCGVREHLGAMRTRLATSLTSASSWPGIYLLAYILMYIYKIIYIYIYMYLFTLALLS